MKGWYAKHKETGKWHKIEDVKDTGVSAENKGGGNNYHLEGVGPVHQSKISDMQEKPPMDSAKKYDRVDVEADGKRELDYGKEDLEKPGLIKELKKRWAEMRKALSSGDSIMTIESQEYHDEDEEQPEEAELQEGQLEEEMLDESGAEQEEGQDLEGREDMDQAPDMPEEDEEQAMDGEPGEGDDDLERLADLLRQEGYSDAEIAYIVHNHMMPQATVDDIKMDGEKQSNENDQAIAEHELEHKKRMSDLEYETAAQEQGINELDKDHKQRMLDLEYEAAKQEKEMELEFKRKELEQKLEAQKEKAAHQLKMKKDNDRARAADAAKTSNKEKAGK